MMDGRTNLLMIFAVTAALLGAAVLQFISR